MATDDEGDEPGPQSSSGLKDLFSVGEGEPEGDEETTESATADSAAGEGDMTDTELEGTSAEGDDAEILTDSGETTGGEAEHAGPEGSAERASGEAGNGQSPDAVGDGGSQRAADAGAGSAMEGGPQTGSDTGGPQTDIGGQAGLDAGGDAEILSDRSKPTRPTVGEESGADEGSPRPSETNRLTTGIPMLDRELEGGIPPGRMLSLVAPPETQSELLVKEMAISRPTVYISTFRPEWEIREELHDHQQKADDEQVIDNDLQVSYVDPEILLDEPMEYIGDIPKGANLIIDSINEFELEDRKRYVAFLNTVKEVLWDTGSVGLFYGIEEATDPPARSLTLKRSDLVWQLDRTVKANEIQTVLIISKFRGGKALTEPVKLVLTDDVQVDMSRDIG